MIRIPLFLKEYIGVFLKRQKLRIKTNFIALHCWPEAPEEVSFLRDPHRHVFHVEAYIETVEDRELEFFMVQSRIKKFLDKEYDGRFVGSKSCETMAEEIGRYLISLYDLREVQVEVNEDGENGSVVLLQRGVENTVEQ